MTDPLTRLAEIEAEARRAIEGLKAGRIENGLTALRNVRNLAGDALAEAAESGRLDYSAESVRMP